MDRYDLYGQLLHPGDVVCYCSNNRLYAGKIHSISFAGTLKIHHWSDEKQLFLSHTYAVKAWQVIKILGIPRRDNT